MEFIKKHKIAIIVLSVILVLLIALFLFLKMFMIDSKKDEYGNRLDGIESVQISSDTVSKLENELGALEEVEDIDYRLQGRLIYISLKMKDGLSVDTAKEISTKVLDYFDDEEKAYYDIQLIVSSANQESEGYPFMGYKHKTAAAIVW